MIKILDSIEKYLLYIVVLLTPILVLSVFPNPYETPKLVFITSAVLILLALKTVKAFFRGSVDLSLGTFDWPLVLLAASVLLSTILRTQNKMEAFFVPGNATLILAGIFIYFYVNQLASEAKKTLQILIFISGLAYSIFYLLSLVGLYNQIPQLPAYVKLAGFTTLGGVFPGIIFLVGLFPLALTIALSQQGMAQRIFLGVAGSVIAFALVLSIYNVLPGRSSEPLMPNYSTSWSIFVDTVKQSPLFGVGAGNYLSAFTAYKPLSYNASPVWAIRFTGAKGFYLTFATEMGLLGVAALAILMVAVFKLAKTQFVQKENLVAFLRSSGVFLSLILTLALLVIFPAVSAVYLLLFILLALSSQTHKVKLNIAGTGTGGESFMASRLPSLVVTVPVLVAVIVAFFFGVKGISAEVTFKKSLDAFIQNDGRATYELMRKSITLDPYVDRYHASFAQVNMAVATSLAQQKDITDTDRQTITTLIQQAISEGKAAITLNPFRAENWELLGSIYQTIMPFAQGADAFAIQAYTQAVALDPVNPNTRLALGGVYYALGRYDDAIRVFELAAFAKPDLANVHYNMAIALRDKGETQKAIDSMNAVISLVTRDSEDYKLAQAELDSLKKKLPAKTPGTSENLTPPQKPEPSNVEPPIELPQEATPPTIP